jgi:hypothetical protein
MHWVSIERRQGGKQKPEALFGRLRHLHVFSNASSQIDRRSTEYGMCNMPHLLICHMHRSPQGSRSLPIMALACKQSQVTRCGAMWCQPCRASKHPRPGKRTQAPAGACARCVLLQAHVGSLWSGCVSARFPSRPICAIHLSRTE